ncbi:MAG: hypothetical protein V1718_04275, partial [archaeon]
MPKFEQFNHLYAAFLMVIDRCILHERSILWPEQMLWTIENLQLLKDRFINSPILDKTLSFEEKLVLQLGDDQPQLWSIVADVYYIFYLPSTLWHFDTKIKGIRQFSERTSSGLPNNQSEIWKPMERGFCNTGRRYNQKYRQFWLLINFFLEIKNEGNAEEILSQRESFQNLLDREMNEFNAIDRAYDMRHAILYLTFPDFYEPIISQRHKEMIVNAFWNQVGGEIPSDVDVA